MGCCNSYKLVKVGDHAESGWAYGLRDGQTNDDPFFCPTCFDKKAKNPLQPMYGGKSLKCGGCGKVVHITPPNPSAGLPRVY